ncbi:MAG: nitrite/sulfite reductase [Planctomycetaceae bacterium]|jgi:sulfite reductase (ferredoxin)|nr:nitrite/sulfite reductase [Planctomycetaceae bacterium]MBT6153918.1 nitrite/sulfite reductase [Planctomycetaceae bacterium]MBT6486611.1 nitrite/sulfite reductase [Planctomycetaceae bacterium]MBT6498174.1 nitrite/sulfite reductase [Planctomycetaceae bacterium]
MKASNSLWKERLDGQLSAQMADELDTFEMEIDLRRQGKVDEKVFAETRLRRGAYGQRYDNGQRYDGVETRQLAFRDDAETKGPNTAWDAPGMQRIKIPFGGMTPDQLEVMAELAEEYSDGIAHITTRQDFQLHFVHIEDATALMRRLAAVGITTREACGNSVRNVTGCPFAGVCADEAFDVSPYADALTQFLLGHPDAQNFGRKFKPSFSGCHQHSCGLAAMHDMGMTAVTREVDGETKRGFRVVVGGGLGTVPYQAKVFDEFMAPEELLPIAQAMSKVFAKHGEKKVRSRARIKFLVANWGIEKFRETVLEERAKLEHDPRWTELIEGAEGEQETPLNPPGDLPESNGDVEFGHWLKTNIRTQRQDGYFTATVALPLGDMTADQLRSLADIARKFTNGTIRTTVEQNFVIRWVSGADVSALYQELAAAGLGEAGAGAILDIVSCPGTDTCKLGISSSRGLAAELRKRLSEKIFELDEAIQSLHIKISGCFNSCGQHHVADIGFYGVARGVHGYKVPHFQVVLGGQWEENAGSYGLPIVAIPSKRIPDAVERITGYYLKSREKGEQFVHFVNRVGKTKIRQELDHLTQNLPEHDADPDFYADWADPREYTTGDIGKGECAGEVISAYEFAMSDAERMVFNAQVLLEEGGSQKAGEEAYSAMIKSAKALVQIDYDDVSNDPDEVVEEFEERFCDTGVFYDPFAGPKFANYLLAAHKSAATPFTAESAHYRIEEAQLFIEAVHSCYTKEKTTAG